MLIGYIVSLNFHKCLQVDTNFTPISETRKQRLPMLKLFKVLSVDLDSDLYKLNVAPSGAYISYVCFRW